MLSPLNFLCLLLPRSILEIKSPSICLRFERLVCIWLLYWHHRNNSCQWQSSTCYYPYCCILPAPTAFVMNESCHYSSERCHYICMNRTPKWLEMNTKNCVGGRSLLPQGRCRGRLSASPPPLLSQYSNGKKGWLVLLGCQGGYM
jgi:hypothetical protein